MGFALDVKEEDLDHEIAVFPNPTNGDCTIEVNGSVYDDAQLYIYDIMGKEMLVKEMNASQYFADAHLDISDFKSGRYIIKIVTNKRTYTKKKKKK